MDRTALDMKPPAGRRLPDAREDRAMDGSQQAPPRRLHPAVSQRHFGRRGGRAWHEDMVRERRDPQREGERSSCRAVPHRQRRAASSRVSSARNRSAARPGGQGRQGVPP